MKHFLKYIIVFSGVIGGGWLLQSCGQDRMTGKERDLLERLHFDVSLLSVLRDSVDCAFQPLPDTAPESANPVAGHCEGVFVETGEEQALRVVMALKGRFRERGYLLFLSDGMTAVRSVVVLKGDDEMDILRCRGTNGENWGLDNEHIVFKMAEWHRAYGMSIIGCGGNWVAFDLLTLPDDTYSFAREVYDFCPDVVDRGVEEIEALEEMIRHVQRLWLWWD